MSVCSWAFFVGKILLKKNGWMNLFSNFSVEYRKPDQI